MIRINCVDPSMLSNKHLKEEFSDIPRVFSLVLQTGESAQWLKGVHRTYSGNLKFFYARCGYLKKRYVEIYKEMNRRKIRPSSNVVKSVLFRAKYIDKEYCDDWEPSREDWEKNIKQLKNLDPKFYRKF